MNYTVKTKTGNEHWKGMTGFQVTETGSLVLGMDIQARGSNAVKTVPMVAYAHGEWAWIKGSDKPTPETKENLSIAQPTAKLAKVSP